MLHLLDRRLFIAFAIALSVGISVGVLNSRDGGSATPASAHDPAATHASDELRVIDALDGDAVVFAMLWRTEDELWFVDSRSDGQLVLHRYTVGTSQLASWPAPLKASQTLYTFLVDDGSGVLWMAANYSIAGFEIASESYTASIALDLRPPELDAGAAEASDFDGTWINGLSADEDGRMLLPRHNTNALFEVFRDDVSTIRTLDRSPSGLRAVDGAVQAFAQENDEVVLIGTEAREPLVDLGESECSLVPQAPGVGAKLVTAQREFATGLLLAPTDPIAFDAKRQWVAIGVAKDGAVVLANCEQGTFRTYTLGSEVEFPDGDLLDPKSVEPVVASRSAMALAVSPSGRVAVSNSIHQVLISE